MEARLAADALSPGTVNQFDAGGNPGMRKLKLSEWANIAEIVGGAVVVMSLVYVGTQIIENTIEVREGN